MEEFLKQLECAVLKTRKRIIGGFSGNYKSKLLGNSYDFYGARIYEQGDDIRKIDWKAYARTEKIYIKQFTEQKQLNVNILLDCSSSMGFGTPNKWESAKMYALGLSYITLKESNKLNLYCFNNKVEEKFKGFMGRKMFHEVVKIIENIKNEGNTDFKNINSNIKSLGGITFIISDLLSNDIENLLNITSQIGSQVVVIHIMSRQEIDPDYYDELKLIDKETGKEKRINFDKRAKQIYKSKVNNYIDNCKKQCEKRDIKYVFASSNTSHVEIILKAIEVG
ncbi:DUF58 domain-containing protein [Haloimpatiens sp. FM7330]|uniref:DUF58 domain-containing protein n=1 Tax=Haloimpatiens sp. FM7330 TaxID=3298610 RepID=UPI00363ED29C